MEIPMSTKTKKIVAAVLAIILSIAGAAYKFFDSDPKTNPDYVATYSTVKEQVEIIKNAGDESTTNEVKTVAE